jgi:HD superfamily phosphodiesterase
MDEFEYNERHMINKVLDLMISYNSPDVRRINHSLKVFTFAAHIAASENCGEKTKTIVAISAILHDIGIHEAEKTYRSTAGKYQEELGPAIAGKLIENLEIPKDVEERVFYLISNHHSYDKIDGIDFQILVESDFLTNIYEDNMQKSAIENIKKKIFKTRTGVILLEKMYLNK